MMLLCVVWYGLPILLPTDVEPVVYLLVCLFVRTVSMLLITLVMISTCSAARLVEHVIAVMSVS
jgi:hypothetical protein